ncbi:MAG: site-2 protease family protein [Clostridia bacterium]|nr:site-2 protease family protein [Clostridia bacterium]
MLTNLFTNPLGTLVDFLLCLPGLLLALCIHEASHGLVALWCGDPTARNEGRITLNPMKHLDPMGFLCMALFHFGWARPVPVNPHNYRNPRRDDLLVSIAGIAANLLMCILGFILMCVPTTMLLRDIGGIGYDCTQFFQMNYALSDLIGEQYGDVAYYLYEMLVNFATINLSLAMFNLLPIPPLDGYHVLNDLILHRTDLFATQQIARIGSGILLLILFVPQLSSLYSRFLSTVFMHIFNGLGFTAYQLVHLLGLL